MSHTTSFKSEWSLPIFTGYNESLRWTSAEGNGTCGLSIVVIGVSGWIKDLCKILIHTLILPFLLLALLLLIQYLLLKVGCGPVVTRKVTSILLLRLSSNSWTNFCYQVTGDNLSTFVTLVVLILIWHLLFKGVSLMSPSVTQQNGVEFTANP